MGLTKRKRKIYIVVGFLLALIVLLIASPLWFPWVLEPILKNYGIRYSQYERKGYNRLVLHDVKFTHPTATFQAGQTEVLFPTTFLWRNFKNDHRENYLRVTNWRLELAEPAEKGPSTNSVFYLSKQLDSLLEDLNRWVPKATLDKGVVHFRDREIAVPSVEWAQGNLSGQIASENLFPETFFNAHLGKDLPKQVLIENPTWNLGGEIAITRQEDESLQIEGGALWRSNRVDLSAEFAREGWLPQTASIQSKSFRIPAEMLKLQGYRDLTGSLDVRWATNRFAIDLIANAFPLKSDEIFLSPVEAVIHASGDTNSIRMETAAISSPWLIARLSEDAEFSFRGELLSDTAVLSLVADLSKQKWIDAKGDLSGQAILRPGTNRFPETSFIISGAEIDVREIQMDQLDLDGEFDWPWLRIGSAKVKFSEGTIAQANLEFNAVTRLVSRGRLKLDGVFGHQFLPPDIFYQNVSLTGEFSGPLKNISHSAHVELRGAKFPQLKPLRIVLDTRGTQLNFDELRAEIFSDRSALKFSGSANVGTNQFAARIRDFSLTRNEQLVSNLEKPFEIFATNSGGGFRDVRLGSIQLRGNATAISLEGNVQWPKRGNVSVAVREFDPSLFGDFFQRPLPETFIRRINLSANWTNGPVNFAMDAFARFASEDGTVFFVEMQTDGNGDGISIERAYAGTLSEAIISGKGFLPVAIVPADEANLLQTLPDQQIDFHAVTTPNSQFWERIAAWTQATFHEPEALISISGTLDSPLGKIVARAKEIQIKPREPDQPIPRLHDFSANIDLVRERIVLNQLEVFVEGQPVTATGELPLPEGFQNGWKQVFDWRKASARLRIVDAQIAPFERLFPELLSPLGTVNMDLAILPGGKLDGELLVADAALRPIPPIGPVRDVQARVRFAGEKVVVQSLQAFIGGEAVNMTGEMNLAKTNATTGLPAFNFKVIGTNVPLARSAELILRSDLNLEISNEKGDQPLVSGKVDLRRSFYLRDLDLNILLPGRIKRPMPRAPYFSIGTEPFSKWRLALAVNSAEFLNVRSPLFRGEIGVKFKLEGTLREPIAIGDARIDSGMIQFPFANFRVEQGLVSLTSEDPFRPQLLVNATSRTFGYDIRLEMTGPVDEPVIEFTSTPGLTSEQILLMVTAGELPREEFQFTPEQRAGRLAFFLGRNLLSRFGVTNGAEDRLELRTGENISEQGRQTYYLEYRLSQDWSIIAEYDRFGALNAGLKWRFYEK